MVYIGSTTKDKVEDRWNEHRAELKKGHRNWKLAFLVAHQGIQDLVFKMELKGYFPTYQDLLNIEGIWIRSITEEFCLNINRYPEYGGGMYGRSHTPEANEKNRQAHLRENLTSETLEKLRIASTGKVAWNKGISPKQETRDKIRKALLGENSPKYGKTGELSYWWGKNFCKRGCEYYILSPMGKYYFITNMGCFSRDFDLTPTLMIRVCKGKRKHHKGWTGSYAE